MSLAQLLAANKENPFKVKAYRRAAKRIRALAESVDELVRSDADLTEFSGIGKGISGAVREIVSTGGLRQLEALRAEAKPEMAAISEYPRLDPARVLRVYKKLGISTIADLKARLESGEIALKLGARMADHVRQALTESRQILLYDADEIVPGVEQFLLQRCGVRRAQVAGDYRRRVEVIHELAFLIETDDFAAVVAKLRTYGGHAELLSADDDSAIFKLSSGIALLIQAANRAEWGLALIAATGSEAHLEKLQRVGDLSKRGYATEAAVYKSFGLEYIEPELREGYDEIELAAQRKLPKLVSLQDIRGELHAHTVSSDGGNTVEQMAAAAQERGYEYLGITDHSKSLKIARGVSEENLWKQIRLIDKLNERLSGFRILKSAEVDILADGSLDYPDDLLRELDYTVCSIHSRFGLGKAEQTERILRAMDNRYFTILGHATGRLLLKRPGYEIDIERVIEHAKENGCFFEINSSPDRLDLSAENALLARQAGVKIAISTDAHSTREFDLIRYGIDQARRAGLDQAGVLNCMNVSEFLRVSRAV